MHDPKWQNGNYNSSDISSINGLALARMIGHITYISKNIMDKKFGRNFQPGHSSQGFNTGFAVESFLHYNSEKFLKRFDPNSYLYLSKAMDTYDMTDGFDNLVTVLLEQNLIFSSLVLAAIGCSLLVTPLSLQQRSAIKENQ